MIKTFICKNPNSRYSGILSKDAILGKVSVDFVFNLHDENCKWPLNCSLFDLINDGWEQI